MDESGSEDAFAAYLYVLGLDDVALAWEYLRRNEQYRRDWHERDRRDPSQWWLKAFEDPVLDARVIEPLWAIQPPLLHLVSIAEGPDAPRLDLWACGCRVVHDGQHLRATLAIPAACVRIALCPRLAQGGCYAYRLPAGRAAQAARAAALQAAEALEQEIPSAVARPARRMELVSMRTLALLDALRAGASERDMGVLLFGAARVMSEWSPESALRAQVRHLIRRGRALVAGGYRKLLGTGDLVR